MRFAVHNGHGLPQQLFNGRLLSIKRLRLPQKLLRTLLAQLGAPVRCAGPHRAAWKAAQGGSMARLNNGVGVAHLLLCDFQSENWHPSLQYKAVLQRIHSSSAPPSSATGDAHTQQADGCDFCDAATTAVSCSARC